VFAISTLVSPGAFQFLFNAQFFGADVASLVPRMGRSAVSFVTLVTVVVMAWVMGCAWAWLYNRFAKVS
jgi:hypothetical protein